MTANVARAVEWMTVVLVYRSVNSTVGGVSSRPTVWRTKTVMEVVDASNDRAWNRVLKVLNVQVHNGVLMASARSLTFVQTTPIAWVTECASDKLVWPLARIHAVSSPASAA